MKTLLPMLLLAACGIRTTGEVQCAEGFAPDASGVCQQVQTDGPAAGSGGGGGTGTGGRGGTSTTGTTSTTTTGTTGTTTTGTTTTGTGTGGGSGFCDTELPPIDASELVGTGIEIDMQSGEMIQPAGVGDLVRGALVGRLFVGIEGVSGGTLELFIGAIEDTSDLQDECVPTLGPYTAEWTNPCAILSEQDIEIESDGTALNIESLDIYVTLTDDGAAEVDYLAVLDTEPLDELLGSDTCELLPTFGTECEPCRDGRLACLVIEVESATGEQLSQSVQPITEDDARELCGKTGDFESGLGCSTIGALAVGAPVWVLAGAAMRRRRERRAR